MCNLRFTIFKTKILNCTLYIVLCTLLFSISSCKKKDEQTNAPQIAFVSISPSSVVEYSDSVTITFSYDDFDGDLGENNPNISNLFITDTRNNVTYNYRISELAPSGSAIHIKGNLNAVIKNTAITDNSSSQSFIYAVYVKDRAGNTSNTILSSAITVTK